MTIEETTLLERCRPACPFTFCRRFFYPQNRPCTPKIVGTFYMQGYKVKEKTAIVPHSMALYPQFQNSVGTLCRELEREKDLAFCNGFNVPTQNLQKRSLMCREHVTPQACYLLCSMVRLSIL